MVKELQKRNLLKRLTNKTIYSMSTFSDVIGNMNDSAANIAKIEANLFTAVDEPKKPLRDGWETPKGKEVYTSDGIWLGSVGDQYQSLQPKDFFNAVVDNVRDSGMNLDLSKLQYNTYGGGKIVEFRLPTNLISFKNAAGKTDDTNMFLNFWTGFGGTARTEMGLYSQRLICSNGMRIINADIDLKVKHTIKMNLKALAFTKELIQLVSHVEATSQIWSEMNNTKVNAATKEEFVRALANMKKEETYADISKKKQKIYDSIQDAMAVEFGRTGSTVWGLLNGATYYTNHLSAQSGESEYVLLATGAKVNTQAQKLALELI
jgi:hypothetical protein